MVPARAGQPTQVLVHLTLAQVRGLPDTSAAEDAWAAARAAQPGWLTGPEAEAALCDATIVPMVTGHVDWAALDKLTETFLLTHTTGRHTTRHPHCAFPGCDQPASVCDIHHIIPRSRGGPTSLPNLVPLCGFHHLTAMHRWGWTLTLHTDGTTTATSPNGKHTLHSHGPPSRSPPGHDPPQPSGLRRRTSGCRPSR
jgi:hypothetical protein